MFRNLLKILGSAASLLSYLWGDENFFCRLTIILVYFFGNSFSMVCYFDLFCTIYRLLSNIFSSSLESEKFSASSYYGEFSLRFLKFSKPVTLLTKCLCAGLYTGIRKFKISMISLFILSTFLSLLFSLIPMVFTRIECCKDLRALKDSLKRNGQLCCKNRSKNWSIIFMGICLLKRHWIQSSK